MRPHLSRIRLYPVKSLDPLEVNEAVILRGAGLVHDREFCLQDSDGKLINGKRLGEKLIKIRSEVNLGLGEITLQNDNHAETFRLCAGREQLNRWFTERLGQKVEVVQDSEHGFPDDTEAPGPTVVATETLQEVASWFPNCTLEEMRRRFRANIEIAGVPAFWEDRLFGPKGQTVQFRIGEVRIEGVNPSARCTVPSRNSYSGEVEEPEFAKIFTERRRETLPPWAKKSRFDHYYRFAVNTRIPASEAGKVLHVEDDVVIGQD